MSDDTAFCRELHAAALGRNRGHILDAFLRERFDHAPGYHVVDCRVVFGKEQRFFARDKQGVVVGHFAVVHAPAGRLRATGNLACPFGQGAGKGEQLRYLREHVFGNIAATGTGIGHEFLLVELLHDVQCLLRSEPVPGVGILLDGCKVIQKRSVLCLFLALDFYNTGRTGCLYLII